MKRLLLISFFLPVSMFGQFLQDQINSPGIIQWGTNGSTATNTFTGSSLILGGVGAGSITAGFGTFTAVDAGSGSISSSNFIGNGAGLWGITATALTGTIADARLSGNVALLNTNNVFGKTNTFTGIILTTPGKETAQVMVGYKQGVGLVTNAIPSGGGGSQTNVDLTTQLSPLKSGRLFSNVNSNYWNTPGTTFFWEEEFMPLTVSAGLAGAWSVDSVGSISGASSGILVPFTYPRFGVWGLTTSTTPETGLSLHAANNDAPSWVTLPALNGASNWESSFIFSANSTANIKVRVGFKSAVSSSTEYANWFGVRYDTASNDVAYTFVCRASSVATTSTNNTPAVDTGWHRVRMRSAVAGTVIFSLDDGVETSIASNMPTTTLQPFFDCVTDAASSKTMSVDYFSFHAWNLGR